jgi:hypothetical protein
VIGYVNAQYTTVFEMQHEATEQLGYDKLMSLLRETLSADEMAALTADGAAWPEERAVEEALATS